MKYEKLSTSELLDVLRNEKENRKWGELADELRIRPPFDDIYYLIEEMADIIGKLGERIRKLEDK